MARANGMSEAPDGLPLGASPAYPRHAGADDPVRTAKIRLTSKDASRILAVHAQFLIASIIVMER